MTWRKRLGSGPIGWSSKLHGHAPCRCRADFVTWAVVLGVDVWPVLDKQEFGLMAASSSKNPVTVC